MFLVSNDDEPFREIVDDLSSDKYSHATYVEVNVTSNHCGLNKDS